MIPPLAALFAWPVISIFFFRTLRLPLAILVTVCAGYLLLPERTSFDLPLVPELDKHNIPILSALLLIALTSGGKDNIRKLSGLLPRYKLAQIMLAVIVLGGVMTVMTNTDPLVYGPLVIRGMVPHDALAHVGQTVIMVSTLLVARKYLAHPDSHVLILKVLCVSGLAYSLLALFEIRMSPQLNVEIYGFFPHSWLQHIRGDGFRPIVFLRHGLMLAIFLSTTILAAIALSRINTKRRGLFLLAAVWLVGTLILNKSLGALLITLALAPVVFLFSARTQLLVAAALTTVFLAYPTARSSQLIPVERFAATIESHSSERAASFRFRLKNEDKLIEKAHLRPIFGWGGWGRDRIYDETGRDITVTDGRWIIELGQGGWVRYLAFFGLLGLPVLLLALNARRYDIGMETSVPAMILAANFVDCIPNDSITPLTWLIAGALWGRLELQREVGTGQDQAEMPPAPAGYRRRFADPEVAVRGAEVMKSQDPVYTRQQTQKYRREQLSK